MIIFSILRSIIASFVFVLFTAFWSTLAILEAFIVQDREMESWILSTWGAVALKLFGVRVQVIGLEKIPAGSCLFLFNHTSFFDIFAMLAAYGDFRYGAKIELFKIPIFGPAMRRLGILPIARQKREEVFRVYQDAQERAKRGEKFALSPEGGRNTKEALLPFKAGPFVFAINSKMPVVPVVIKGANSVLNKHGILPNWDRWSRVITVQYLDVIASEAYTVGQRTELQDKVYQEMASFFNQNPT